jgi:hypothetical protein
MVARKRPPVTALGPLPPANCRPRRIEFAAGGGGAAFSVAAHAAVAKPLGEKGDGERVEAHSPRARRARQGGGAAISARAAAICRLRQQPSRSASNSRVGGGAAPEGNHTPSSGHPDATVEVYTIDEEQGGGKRPPASLLPPSESVFASLQASLSKTGQKTASC